MTPDLTGRHDLVIAPLLMVLSLIVLPSLIVGRVERALVPGDDLSNPVRCDDCLLWARTVPLLNNRVDGTSVLMDHGPPIVALRVLRQHVDRRADVAAQN